VSGNYGLKKISPGHIWTTLYVANACRHAVSTTNYERSQLHNGNSYVLRSDDDGWNSKHSRVFPV